MKQFYPKVSVILAVVSLLLMQSVVFAADQPSKDSDKAIPESPPAYTELQAQSCADKVLTVLEQVTGKKLKTAPKIMLVSRADMVKILCPELVLQAHKLSSESSEVANTSAAMKMAEAQTVGLLGEYSFHTKILYLLPGNLWPLMDYTKADRKYDKDFLTLVVAHELTHCLQDQEVGLTGLLDRADTPDKSLAIEATLEGQALLTQDMVAASLGLEEAEKVFEKAIFASPISPINSAQDISARMIDKSCEDTYIGGRDFMKWHYDRGGNDKLWSIVQNPPASTTVIYHPESYSASAATPVNYEAILKHVEPKLGKGDWKVTTGQIGEMQARAMFAGMDPALCKQIMADFDSAETLLAFQERKVANISVIIFKSSSAARTMISAAESMAKDNMKAVNGKGKLRFSAPIACDYTGCKSDFARKLTFSISAEGCATANEMVRIARGCAVVEIYIQNLTLNDSSIAEIATQIFSELPQEKLSQTQDATTTGANIEK